MATISKLFAKAIVKKRKINDWNYQFEESGNVFKDTAFVEFDLEKLKTLLSSLGNGTKNVRIYLGKYPKDYADVISILEHPSHFHPQISLTQREKESLALEYKFVEDSGFQKHTTVLFVGVDSSHNEIFEQGSGNKIVAISGIKSIENHGDLRPPNPPTDSNSLYSAAYVSYP